MLRLLMQKKAKEYTIKKRNAVHTKESGTYMTDADSRQRKAQKINRADVVAKGKQKISFRVSQLSPLIKLGGYIGAHGKAAQKADDNGIKARGAYTEQRL